ncbi:MAG: hypothetical protein OEV49_13320 [candidate division Zixibacteria bacterium]|nr:hypothetical protein [candidate division Zixibacteria bacterium]MDH3939201.1 hypothetical protein [candidate division Zixibacteria bacterium]
MTSQARTFTALLLVTVCTLCVAATGFAGGDSSGGPPDVRTGAPGEGLCTDCHGGTVNSGDGSFGVTITPPGLVPGQDYTITVTLGDPGQSRWGFELTALAGTDAGSEGAGVFTITDPTNTQLSDGNGNNRDYVKQTSTGTFNGTADGPVSWSFQWTAPLEPAHQVDFYVAGNAANGGGTSGDYIYTDHVTLQAVAAVPSTSLYGLILLALLLIAVSVFIMRARVAATK